MSQVEKLLHRVAQASGGPQGIDVVALQKRERWSWAAFLAAFGVVYLIGAQLDLPFTAGWAGGAGGLAMTTGLRGFALVRHPDFLEFAAFKPMSTKVERVERLAADTSISIEDSGLLQDRVRIGDDQYLLSRAHRSRFQDLLASVREP